MSQRNKLSLWQKIKRFLTASAPQSVVDATSEPAHSSIADNEHGQADAPHLKSDGLNTDNMSTDNLGTSVNDLNAESQNPSETPIVDCLKQYFSDKQWHYTHYRPKAKDSTNGHPRSHHLSLRMRHKQINCGYLFRVQEKTKLLAIYGILPFLIPESHQSAAMLLITQINYDMLIGSLEMDVNDGEIRYKNAIDVEAVGIDNDIIEHLLQSVVAMTTVANELFGDLINDKDSAKDMQTLLAERRQQSDARTFFLPTQSVQ